jgi:regulator of protease activity HflC (stomatin/prohibitin superfamily)
MRRLAFLLVLLPLGACVSHRTGETEVGVLVCKVALGCDAKGVQAQLYPPGSTNFFAPWIRDFYTFDTRIQNLEMTAKSTRGDRSGPDDLQFKTNDGNDVYMDVTVVWQIDPIKAPQILQTVGESTAEVKEKLVRPMARTLVHDVMNELTSESIYNADKRFEKSEEARKVLSDALGPYGVIVTQVNVSEYRFNEEYQQIIHNRKLAEAQAEQLKSEAQSAQEEAKRNLETAKGKVAADIAAADGELAQAKLHADAEFYQQQQNAQAILTERTNNATAIAKRSEALKGAGGRAQVKIKVAEALAGKSIVLIPGGGGSGVSLNKLDVNKLVESVIAQDVQVESEEKDKEKK